MSDPTPQRRRVPAWISTAAVVAGLSLAGAFGAFVPWGDEIFEWAYEHDQVVLAKMMLRFDRGYMVRLGKSSGMAALQKPMSDNKPAMLGAFAEAASRPGGNRQRQPFRHVLHMAIAKKSSEMVEALLSACPWDSDLLDRALASALKHEELDIIAMLIQAGADPDAQEGLPLRDALRRNRLELADALVALGADPDIARAWAEDLDAPDLLAKLDRYPR